MICEFCNKEFANMSSLNVHKKTAKYCLKIQNENGCITNFENKCYLCLKSFSTKTNLKMHFENICIDNTPVYFKTGHLIFKLSSILKIIFI